METLGDQLREEDAEMSEAIVYRRDSYLDVRHACHAWLMSRDDLYRIKNETMSAASDRRRANQDKR